MTLSGHRAASLSRSKQTLVSFKTPYQDYQVPFPFNGTINNVTVKLGPVQLGEADQKLIQHALARAGD